MSRIQLIIYCVVVAGLVALGVYMKKGYDAIQEVKRLNQQRNTELEFAKHTDETVAEKIKTNGAADQELSRIRSKREEMRHENQDYDDYLSQPIPAESKRLYELAGKVRYGLPEEHPRADGAESGTR